MRKAESTPSKLLLLPLIPALALGIIEVASHLSLPASSYASVDQAPPSPPPPCTDCTMAL
jgi:hypothetical protein